MHNPTRRAAAAAVFAAAAALAPCQGLFVPGPAERLPGPMPRLVDTGLLQIQTAIVDGAASTELVQTLRNHTPQPQEAWWLLPLPAGAVADRFTLTIDGKPVAGEVLDAARARGIYEEIVRKRRDPGLLEYVGDGLLRARVFPIPPNGEVRVAVRWSEVLPVSDGLVTWRFPMRAAWSDGLGPERLSLVVDVRSRTAIKTLWSPQPGIDLVRDGDNHARAGLELPRSAVPPRDLALHYGLGEQDFGAHVLSFARPGQDGYWLMLLAPRRDWPKQAGLARSINLVLDTSGSMAGEKIQQARAAARTFLQSLAPGDFFDVIPFSTDARPFFPEPVAATREHVQEALQKVDALEARGGTDIDDALGFALAHALPPGPPRAGSVLVPITVFLTDGLPTVGTTDVDQLLQKARTANAAKARVFVFGVGSDVNTRLLDTLAQESRGDRDYVQPGENIECKTGDLFAKLSGPVMTDLQLTVDGVPVADQEPRLLPDLFVQGQIVVVGRYHGGGHGAIRLRGRVGQDVREYLFEAGFATQGGDGDWIPSLWAQKRVAALLDAVRLNGQQAELVAEVTRLGKEFGLVTPYTSHLVVEEGQQIAQFRGVARGALPADERSRERLRRDWLQAGAPAADAAKDLTELFAESKQQAAAARDSLVSGPAGPTTGYTGYAAVERSKELRDLAGNAFGAGRTGAAALLHLRVRDRTFHLVQAVWVDAAFTADMQARVQRIEAFSDAYFALLRARPQLAPFLAFSTAIVVVDGGEAFEIVPGA